MKKILIHCAMEKEAEKIAKKMKLVKIENANKKYKTIDTIYERKTENNIINLVVTGIGKQRAAIGLTEYLSKIEYKPDLAINIGYAGANNIKIGTLVCISNSFNLEWDIPGEEKYSLKNVGNQKLIKVEGLEYIPCYSAETFITKTDIKEKCIFDMELHSAALIADIYKIPLISIKKVTDNLSIDKYYESINTKEIMELENAVELIEKYII